MEANKKYINQNFMAKIDRPAIVAGNDTTLYIKLKEFKDGEYVDDFDLTQVSDLKVELLCSRDNYRYEIPYNIDPTYKNLIICDLKHTYYHTNTSYGINVTGTNKDGKHWTWCMMPREGFLVVSNTSGLHLTDEAQQLSFNGLVGWGISTGTDLTNYYTKITIDNLLNEKADKSSLAKVATSGDYNDLTNKPIVKEQVQSDWNENDKTKPDYIKNKPDLSQYIKEQDLNNYYDKAEVDVMLNNKVDTSTLNSDYYSKNEVNNLLNEKVDTSDLSQVAISGDYNELTNKPDLSQYATKEEVNAKQDTLISGENIKTINGNSILGSGNIEIQGGSGGTSYTAGKNIDIADNVISTTNDIDATTVTTEDIKIKKTESVTVNYISWYDGAPHRYIAGGVLNGIELRAGENWYTYTNSWLNIDTQNDGLISISYSEWTHTEDVPSWVNHFGYPAYKSSSLINGQPVYGMYNPDSDSPDFYIYEGEYYGVKSIYVDYVDIPSYNPISYWKIKGGGMFINKENDTTNNSFGGERQVSIGENNNFGGGENKLMVGDNLEGEYQGNQLLVGYHNREKNALFAVGNGEYSTSFYPYDKTINNDHSFTIWTTLNEEAFNQSTWALVLYIRNTDDTTLFAYIGSMNSLLNEIESYPYSYDFSTENREDGTTYYTTVTLQRDNDNLGITFDLYTDEQHTSTYNVIDSTAEIREASVVIDMPYKRDAFFVTSDGNVYIPYFQDRNNTYNLGEAVYNLEQRPQPVQSNWNETDESNLAYIQNKPDLNQYATKEEVNGKQDTLVSGSNIKTINGQDILGSGDIVISSGDKPYEEQYLTIETLEDDCDIVFEGNNIQYSINGISWDTLNQNEKLNFQNVGFKIRFKQTGLTPDSSKGIGTFKVSKKFKVYGNAMSLYYGDDFIGQTDLTGKDYAFKTLFYQCSNLINAENLILPATTLSPYCYYDMFSLCTLLTKTPKLPATTLAENCYRYMFSSCYSLTDVTELPATQLTEGCYSVMFFNCKSLTTAPELPATQLASSCYESMFSSCISLVKAPELPATHLASSCYSAMFSGCTELAIAPELPATQLASSCYESMFNECSNLTIAPELPAKTLASSCYGRMFKSCTRLVKAPELPATELQPYCYISMFRDCLSLKKAPELPATTLVDNCYYYMFYDSSNLNYIKCLATDISASNSTYYWYTLVNSSGTFITADNPPAWPSDNSGIPSGWNVYTESQYEEVRHYELANVAKTGDYNDLINKPNISEAGFIKVNDGSDVGLVNSLSSSYNKSIGNKAVIEGDGYGSELINASGSYSHAEGYATTSRGDYSHAEGYKSMANGTCSHSEGYNSSAAGSYSHAEGRDTYAPGYYAHAEGFSTKANNQSEHASGQYNVCNKNNTNFGDSGNTLLSVGNGSSVTDVHNAFEIRQNGDIYYSDTEKIDGSTVYHYNAPMKKLQDVMVTSESTSGLKIEVVNVLPETPAENTIYIIV